MTPECVKGNKSFIEKTVKECSRNTSVMKNI